MARSYRLIVADEDWEKLVKIAASKGMTVGKYLNELIKEVVSLAGSEGSTEEAGEEAGETKE